MANIELINKLKEYINYDIYSEEGKESKKEVIDGFLLDISLAERKETNKAARDLICIMNMWGENDISIAGFERKTHILIDDTNEFKKINLLDEYYDSKKEIPLVPLAHINMEHLNKVVKINILLKSNTPIRPDSSSIYYYCNACKERYYKFIKKCELCDSKDIIKIGDIRDTITGIVEEIESSSLINRSPVSIIVKFSKDVKKTIDSLYLSGNYLLTGKIILRKIKDKEYFEMEVYSYEFINDGVDSLTSNQEEEEKIKNISQREDLIEYLSKQIFGNDLYNLNFLIESILLMMASSPKTFINKDVLKNRGNIMILLAGSPGTAKSQLLKRTASFFPKSRFATGSNSTAIGLVASVVKDERVGEYILSPGALGMCHKGGILCVDELDKVDKDDLTKMNTQMDSLFIQVDKANIHRRILADVSILGAMNPKHSTWDKNDPLYDQLNLKKDFMDRFDLIFNVNYYKTKDVSKIIDTSCKAYFKNEEIEVDLDLLRKYFSYVRKINVTFDKGFIEHIKKEYLDLLGKSKEEKETHYSLRLVDNIIRLSCAYARLRLSDRPDFVDVKRAAELMKESFKSLGIYDENKGLDVYKTEKVETQSFMDKRKVITSLLKAAPKGIVSYVDLEEQCKFDDFEKIIFKMKLEGEIIEPKNGQIKLE